MILLKLYATLVITALLVGVFGMIYSIITDDLRVGDFGLKTFATACGGFVLGLVLLLVALLWA